MTIDSFSGEHGFLSNFHVGVPVRCFNIEWPTAEHAYQAMKTTELETRIFIRNLDTPGKAKRAGQTITLRSDWEEIKFDVMRMVVSSKFMNNITLGAKLIDTGDALLIEGNTWGDKTWGMVKENGQYIGSNLLGQILMNVRQELRRRQQIILG